MEQPTNQQQLIKATEDLLARLKAGEIAQKQFDKEYVQLNFKYGPKIDVTKIDTSAFD